jgi:hypothetical protein
VGSGQKAGGIRQVSAQKKEAPGQRAAPSRAEVVSGCLPLGHIGLRHAANIAVLEGASTGPLDHFTDSLLLGRGNAARRCQELVVKPVEPRTSRRPVTIVVGRR